MKAPFYSVFLDNDEKRDITYLIESFKYEECTEEDDLLSIRIASKYAEEFDKDSEIKEGTKLLFKFGYIGGLVSKLKRARITDISYKYAERVSIEVKALDLGNVMKKVTSSKVWVGTTKQIAQEIAGNYGLDLVIDYEGRTWNIPQGNDSDFEFLQKLVLREQDGNYIMFVSGNDLKIVKKGLNKASAISLTYGEASSGIISFTSNYSEATAKTEGIGNTVKGFDPLNKKPIEKSTSPDKQDNACHTGEKVNIYNSSSTTIGTKTANEESVLGSVSQKLKDTVLGRNIVSTSSNSEDVSNLSNSLNKKGAAKMLTGSLVLEGNPVLEADAVITMLKVFKRDLGNWYSKKVAHEISGSGYRSTVQMDKNASKKGKVASRNPNTSKGKSVEECKDTVTVPVYDANSEKIGISDSYVAAK